MTRKFSEFSKEETPLEGDKIAIEKILNIELVILAFIIRGSKFKTTDYLTLQCEKDGKKIIIFTSSSVLSSQIKRYEDKLPFVAKIIKIDRYFTFA